MAGLVVDTLYRPGEWVPAGAPVVSLLPPANVKIRFYVPETTVGTLRLGDAVSVHCDGCGADIAAAIRFIAPQAEFTPPVIYSRENRAKLVFLVEARPRARRIRRCIRDCRSKSRWRRARGDARRRGRRRPRRRSATLPPTASAAPPSTCAA